MRQITFANQASFEKFSRKSKREQFLETMDSIIPWPELQALIEPYYPKAGNGRQPDLPPENSTRDSWSSLVALDRIVVQQSSSRNLPRMTAELKSSLVTSLQAAAAQAGLALVSTSQGADFHGRPTTVFEL
jgi:hypothetical protein